MKGWWTGFVLISGFLAGCDLEEAQRMDLTRSRVGTITAQEPRVLWRGQSSSGWSRLARDPAPANGWSVEWGDRGTEGAVPSSWELRMLQPDSSGLLVSGGEWGSVLYLRPAGGGWSWFDGALPETFLGGADPRGLICRLAWAVADSVVSRPVACPLFQDWNDLLWDAALDPVRTVHRGDTVSLSFRAGAGASAEALDVASDHAGLRIVGDYSLSLEPGQAGTLRWVVLASAGEAAWIDLRWGPFRSSHRFGFQVVP